MNTSARPMHDHTLLISEHHVGGRAGTGTVGLPRALRDGMRVHLYEADQSCIAEAEEGLRRQGIDARLLPVCVGDNRGSGRFHIMGDPSASSIRELNPRYAGWFYETGAYDFVAEDTHRTDRVVTVDTNTLDNVCLGDDAIAIPPHLLSLDAQGGAFEVLCGATGCLAEHVLAVVSEIEFVELYAGQKRFGDITTLLEGHGLQFMSFLHLRSAAPQVVPMGCRTMKSHPVGTVLYLRALDRMPAGTPQERALALHKLAFIALLFEQVEYACAALRQARAIDGLAVADMPGWLRLTTAFDAALAEMERAAPRSRHPSWKERMAKRLSAGQPAVPQSFFNRRIRPWIDKSPTRQRLYVALRVSLRESVTRIRAALAAATPAERVLEQGGLVEQAESLRRHRCGL